MGCWDSFLDWLAWVVCGEAYTTTHRGASNQATTPLLPTAHYSPRHQHSPSYSTLHDASPRPQPTRPFRPPGVHHRRQLPLALHQRRRRKPAPASAEPYSEHLYPSSSRLLIDDQPDASTSHLQSNTSTPRDTSRSSSPALVLSVYLSPLNDSTPHSPSYLPRYLPAAPSSSRSYIDYNQLNQQNEYYVSLRADAKKAYKVMKASFARSKRANPFDKKTHRDQALQHRAEMLRSNEAASEWIFRENNLYCASDEVDLHGLTVAEAIKYTNHAIQDAKERGSPSIRLIVGKGLHTADGIPKLPPAVLEHMQKKRLSAQIDPRNTGVLIVNLSSEVDSPE